MYLTDLLGIGVIIPRIGDLGVQFIITIIGDIMDIIIIVIIITEEQLL
jgi:hypothetical protein